MASTSGEEFIKQFSRFVEKGRNILEAEMLEALQDPTGSVQCTKVSSNGLWHEFGMQLSKNGMIQQDLYLTFLVTGELLGITQEFDVEINLQFITNNFDTQLHNTWIKVSSSVYGEKHFSNHGSERQPQWFANITGDEKDKAEREQILEDVKKEFDSPLHFAVIERCLRLYFSKEVV